MKNFSITALFLGAIAAFFLAQPAKAQVGVSVSIGGFHDELAPYGQWVDCRYGQCWVPHRVNAGWQPYTNGQWVYTEYGWTWVSDDPWGGNPYHYGTWISLDQYGWSWIPGTVWAPAWVTWSFSDRYVGWAPLPPTVVFGMSGYAGRAIVVSSAQYVFVPTNRFVGTNVSSVRVSAQQNATIFRQTRPVTRFTASGGILRNTAIPLATIQRASGSRIETRSIRDAKATPRSMTAGMTGKSRRVAIVAPASEMKSAATSRPQAGSRSAAPSENKGRKPEAQRELRKVKPESRQGSPAPRATARPKQQEQKAPKAHEASPEKSRGRAVQAPPPQHRQEPPKGPGRASQTSSQPRQESSKAPARIQERPSEPRHAAPPAETRQQQPARVEARPGPQQTSAHSAKPAPAKQGPKNDKAVKKDENQKR